MCLGRWLCAAVLACGLAPQRAHANAGDVVGLGSEAIARGGAMVADTDAHEAVFYNPAGLAYADLPELTLGYGRIHSALSLQLPGEDDALVPTDQRILEPDSVLAGIVIPFDHGGVGFHLTSLPDKLVRVLARRPETPFFPYYENRTQRVLVLVGGAWRPISRLSLGLGANFFAGLRGIAIATEGPTREVEPIVFEDLPARARLHAGIRFDALPELSFAASYRQSFVLPYETTTSNNVSGVPLDVSIEARGLQTPHTVTVGAAGRVGGLTLTLDGAFMRWSSHRAPFVRVEALVSGVRIAPLPPPGQYRDTWSLRFGAEYEHVLGPELTLRYRAGVHYEPSMLRPQTGRTNLVDGDKIGVGAGLGLELPPIDGLPFRVDVHFGMTHVMDRFFDKVISSAEDAADDAGLLTDEDPVRPGDQITNVGFPRFGGGGQVYTVGLSLTVALSAPPGAAAAGEEEGE